MEQKQKIKDFITENLIVFEDEIDFQDDDNIFQMGYVNSLFAMKLLNYIENEFQVKIQNEEMDIKNFSSVNAIINLLNQKAATV